MFNSGLIPSVIDGSEHMYEMERFEIPIHFSYQKNLPSVLNQGADPICVPCSISAWCEYRLAALSGKRQNSKFKLFDIFNSRTTSGEGMTCKEAFKYLINTGAAYKNGLIKANRYFKVNSILALRNAILNNGPCIAVLPVFDTNADEFWKGSSLQGYHAVSVVGYDPDGFIIRNSWGESYGYDGYSYITNDDLQKSKEIWTLI